MRTFSKKALALFLSLVFVVGCIVPVAAAGKKFADVKENQWFYSYVDYMAEKKVIQGHDTGLFAPNDNVKRNEFITMINNLFGLTEEDTTVSFTDVPANSWYAKYYRAAYKQGYLQKAFGEITAQQPTKELTREEAVALLMAYLNPDIDISNQTLSFTDASSINSKYADFIRQSVYQGIVIGYDDNSFKPRKTLTRAEAATILCKAAGTIITTGAVTAPETTVSGNAIINGRDTTLNFHVDGDVIVTEAVDGIVTIRNANINGTVYIRGGSSSSVEFSNCKVASIVVEGESLVVLSGGTSVTDLALKKQTMIGMTGATVKNFKVEATAKDSIVRSEGNANAVENYEIYATGFNSQVLHSGSIKFGTGIKATIAGKEYSGSGFVANSLRTSWNSGVEYIHYSVVNDGYVDYFYSKTSVDSTKFATLYNATAAALKGTKTVSVGQSVNEKTVQAAIDYKYIVIGFRMKNGTYEGVKVIDRELELYGIKGNVTTTYSSTGFKVSFTVGINDTAHSGLKTYYTFTDDQNFSAADIKNISLYKTVTSGMSFKEADAEGKKYIAIFVYENGIVHEPKLAEVPVFYNGFTAVPTITINGEDKEDTLSFSVPGTVKVKYFYVKEFKENYTKNETTFNNEYHAMPAEQKGEFTANASTKTQKLKKAKDVEGMMLVVLCVAGNDPIYITRLYSGTGFADKGAPVAYEIGDKRVITFTPALDCDVKYMYVDSVKSFTARGFNELYEKTGDTLKEEIKNCKKDKPVFAGLKTPVDKTKYLAVMLTGAGVNLQPICITLVDPGTGVKSATYSADYIAESLKFTATHNFGTDVTVSYEAFYVNSDSVSQLDSISQMKKANNSTGNKLFDQLKGDGCFTINADGTVDKGKLPDDIEKEIAIRMIITLVEDNKEVTYYLTPFVITITKFDYGFDSTSVTISENEGRENIKLDLEEAGTIKYYYTNSVPANATAFETAYKAATYSGKETVTEGENLNGLTMGDNHVYALAGYKYVVFLFTDKDGKVRTPQVVEREKANKENATAIYEAIGRLVEGTNIEVVYTLIDVFASAKVTPYISYMTSKTKLKNIDLDDFTSFHELNGSSGTDGVITRGYNVSTDVNYVYIVVGVDRDGDRKMDYKFLPYEVVIPRTNMQ